MIVEDIRRAMKKTVSENGGVNVVMASRSFLRASYSVIEHTEL